MSIEVKFLQSSDFTRKGFEQEIQRYLNDGWSIIGNPILGERSGMHILLQRGQPPANSEWITINLYPNFTVVIQKSQIINLEIGENQSFGRIFTTRLTGEPPTSDFLVVTRAELQRIFALLNIEWPYPELTESED